MIAFEHIKLFLGENKSLSIDNFEIDKGLWALIGRNGTGKTTFLKAVSGFHHSYEGNIKINGKIISEYKSNEMAKLLGGVYTKPSVFGHLTGQDVLFLGRIPYQNFLSTLTKEDKAKVDEIIALLSLENIVQKKFNVLSDGEKQLIMIGRLLVQETKIILLDEPTAFLDVVNKSSIILLLKKIADEQEKIIIFSTHDVNLIEAFCDGILLIHQNQMSLFKDVENMNKQIEKLYEV